MKRKVNVNELSHSVATNFISRQWRESAGMAGGNFRRKPPALINETILGGAGNAGVVASCSDKPLSVKKPLLVSRAECNQFRDAQLVKVISVQLFQPSCVQSVSVAQVLLWKGIQSLQNNVASSSLRNDHLIGRHGHRSSKHSLWPLAV